MTDPTRAQPPHAIPLGRPAIGDQELAAADRVLRSGRLTQGPGSAAFEEELAATGGRRYAVAVSSGTAALHLSLWALGIAAGQTVRVPAFTFPATANVVRLLGAAVELVDVNPATFCMRLPDKLPRRPAAADQKNDDSDGNIAHSDGNIARSDGDIAHSDEPAGEIGGPRQLRQLVVHQFGFPAKVFPGDVSDAACAAGVRAAMQGVAACLSFHPRKILTTGEGGAVLTDDEGLRDAVVALRAHGLLRDPLGATTLPAPGLNYRLPEVSAAIGRVQLRRLPSLLAERRALADHYRARLRGSSLTLQADTPARAWQTFAVVLPERAAAPGSMPGADRDRVRAALARDGIETQIASYGLHTLSAYRAEPARFPVADALHHRALALPLFNGLDLGDVDRVCESLLAALEPA